MQKRLLGFMGNNLKFQKLYSIRTSYFPKNFAIIIGLIFLLNPIQYANAENNFSVYLPTLLSDFTFIPLVNGDFEQGNQGWTLGINASVLNSGYMGFTPHSGNRMAFLDAGCIKGMPCGPTLAQSFTVPSSSPYLGIWWSGKLICTPISDPWCPSQFNVNVDDIYWKIISGATDQPWIKSVVDLSAFKGKTIKFTILCGNGWDHQFLFIDDIAFQDNPEP